MATTAIVASPPDPGLIIELLSGFRASKVLFTLVELRILDALHDCSGATVEQLRSHLAVTANADVSLDGVKRLLSAGASLGLVQVDVEGRFSLSPVSEAYLVSSADNSLTGYVKHSDRVLYTLWGGLDLSVRSGQTCWRETHGYAGSECFANVYRSPEDMLQFMHGMHSFAKLSAAAVLKAVDLSQCTHLVDLGGATGALAVEALRSQPNLRATVVDLPDVVALAQRHFTQPPHVRDAALLPRLNWLAADFFTEPQRLPADADVIVLARILHDWDEARCQQLLRTVAAKLRPGGALLICEMLLDESGVAPKQALLQSLNMLVQTNGRERKLSEYAELLATAGFDQVRGHVTGSYLDAIVAYKT